LQIISNAIIIIIKDKNVTRTGKEKQRKFLKRTLTNPFYIHTPKMLSLSLSLSLMYIVILLINAKKNKKAIIVITWSTLLNLLLLL
jgi:cell division protein FtsW (lipid II flippase)